MNTNPGTWWQPPHPIIAADKLADPAWAIHQRGDGDLNIYDFTGTRIILTTTELDALCVAWIRHRLG